MRALDQARYGMEIVKLNDSERFLNMFPSFFNFYIWLIMDINNIYQYKIKRLILSALQ